MGIYVIHISRITLHKVMVLSYDAKYVAAC